MARIAGVDVPRDKRIEIALTYIYGIGSTTAKRMLSLAAVSPDTRTKDLTDAQVGKLRDVIAKQLQGRVEGDLRRQIALNIKRLTEIGTYRGLPVRGQRTRTNARTRRGPKKTVGVRRKKATK